MNEAGDARPEIGVGRQDDRYAVVGHPLDRTLSPPMHNAAFRHYGLPAVYVPVPLPPDGFEEGLRRLVEEGIRGLNVTVPFKEEAFRLCDVCTEVARLAASVNTIKVQEGRLVGTSTDGEGLLRDLGSMGVSPQGFRVALYGAGGAARAVGQALLQAGARELLVVVRRPQEVEWIPRGRGKAVAWGALAEGQQGLGPVGLLINATPIGTGGAGEIPVPWRDVDRETVVYDLVYDPAVTPLLAAARGAGCRARNGLGMLLHQGAAAFEFWTGHPAPLEAMADAIGLDRDA
jgi:shikimate dehydrogenase